jgi:hypothetical protein
MPLTVGCRVVLGKAGLSQASYSDSAGRSEILFLVYGAFMDMDSRSSTLRTSLKSIFHVHLEFSVSAPLQLDDHDQAENSEVRVRLYGLLPTEAMIPYRAPSQDFVFELRILTVFRDQAPVASWYGIRFHPQSRRATTAQLKE